MASPHADCGDPSCDTCRPPQERCAACGALHAEAGVPFCSLDCAIAGEPAQEPQQR